MELYVYKKKKNQFITINVHNNKKIKYGLLLNNFRFNCLHCACKTLFILNDTYNVRGFSQIEAGIQNQNSIGYLTKYRIVQVPICIFWNYRIFSIKSCVWSGVVGHIKSIFFKCAFSYRQTFLLYFILFTRIVNIQ